MPGEGVSSGQQVVQRIRVEDLLAIRLALLDLPPDVSIPNSCLWNSPTRKDELTLIHNTPRQLRDVSALVDKKKTKKESEPLPLEDDCKPLEINEDTRWKARVFDGNAENVTAQEHGENETDDSVLKKALLILNKLSLTKFDKLSDDFLACGIGRNEKCLRGATQLIVKKAQDEQHFSAMYASLCLKLAATPMALDEGDDAKKGKKFKKMLLEECQKEFEEDTTTKIEIATKDVTDKDEKRIVADLVKKHYLGHMRFIGELYKGDIISIKIMLHCLPALLENDRVIRGMEDIGSRSEIDEEKIECFTKLMATIGFSLEQQSEAMKSVKKVDASKKLEECWNRVAVLAGLTPGQCPNVSTRIKYLLQDLVELKNSGTPRLLD
jgi:translation initiation factor 4G